MSSLGDIAALTGAEIVALNGASPSEAAGIVVSSATVRAQDSEPGTLFAALPGERTHGASFIGEAIAAGASAVLTDPDGVDIARRNVDHTGVLLVHPAPRDILGIAASAVYGNPSSALEVVGITGTSGKTTTSHFLEAAVTSANVVTGLIGTTGSRVANRPLPSSLTTPEATRLQGLLAEMRTAGAGIVVAEVSSHALRLGRVDGTRFAVGAFTNLSQDHLDFHPTMSDYFAAKTRLFVDSDPGTRVRCAEQAVVVVDDSWGRQLAELRSDAIQVSSQSDAQLPGGWTASASIRGKTGGQDFTAIAPSGQRLAVHIAPVGRFNVANALVALACCELLGLDLDKAAAGLANARVPGRLEPVACTEGFDVVVDFAHKPGALECVLSEVRAHTSGRVACVVGAGGDRDRSKREPMGRVAASNADLVVVTDDNPRSESPALIRTEVRRGASAAIREASLSHDPTQRGETQLIEISDRAEAIRYAIEWATTGDSVVIAGKGNETGQQVRGRVLPFDDREVARNILQARLGIEKGARP